MNKVVIYPVHKKAVLEKKIRMRVRAVGDTSWISVDTYRVKVDMHDVRMASMAYFDFEGQVEVEVSGPYFIYQADIRPLSKGIEHCCDSKTVRFILEKPVNLSIELNQDRYHNLHLFAGKINENVPESKGENTLVIKGSLSGHSSISEAVLCQLEKMPKGRILYIEPGMHHIVESVMKLPSDTNVYLAGGSIIVGGFICSEVENVRIYGQGMIYQADFHRFGGINGLRISHSRNIMVEDIIFINPPHYTVHLGQSRNVVIRNIKAFSCEGWSDGIDMMSCQDVLVEGGFLRNSDDCIAVYGSRWDYYGDSKNITVKDLTVWADVAHPLNMGGHGDHEHEGDMIEDIHFNNIDILEHNEHQSGYLGCMSINVGDKNTVRNIAYENIRIEPFKRGKILDFQVLFNPKYNPAPGRRIENITLKNIQYHGSGEVPSLIRGYNEERTVDKIHFQNILINEKRILSLKEANIDVGNFVSHVTIE